MTKNARFTIRDFGMKFPDDTACLEWIKDHIHPDGVHCDKCEKITGHHKMRGRRAYACQDCGSHYYPTAGTIFHKSRTPLRLWFYAMYLMASTRCGIAAKQLERELGVTYKTAWRMFKRIRILFQENRDLFDGPVEADEVYIGGRRRGGKPGRGTTKTIVAGVSERDGGKVATRVVPNASAQTLVGLIEDSVKPGGTVHTDEWIGFKRLTRCGFIHGVCSHGAKQYVVGDSHTNTIEGFWSVLKGGIQGVYRGRVQPEYLQAYVDEYAFRYNHRNDPEPMFENVIGQIAKTL